ncbi:hypothetical protein E8L99_19615 [Phreatobacter aquaticus]|uniref:Serine kinase n=1 Tax=Phreatobacter aquaticus TaxID=2570229 RepID=A0A4D7QRC9_9HYPH|nr:hypothetical protein [Phreatobacter aquaticus]QCK87804.1 hypothetical protein E8L99_19615 [Phreatobacter aquaticus]
MSGEKRSGATISRTLTHRLTLVSPDPAMQATLGYLACDPEVAGPEPSDSLVEVLPSGRHWRIVEEGRADIETLGVDDTLAELHGRLFDLSLSDRPSAPILHAASLVRNGRRILLVGRKGAGKTTLTLRLALSGFTLESDENLFVTGAGIVARPRGCRIKESSLPWLPRIADVIEGSPFIVDYRGARIFNLDPRSAGVSWSIAEGPVDAILLLRSNHGGLTTARDIPSMALIRGLMAEIAVQKQDRVSAFASLARLASASRGFDVSLGDLDGAIALVEAITASMC